MYQVKLWMPSELLQLISSLLTGLIKIVLRVDELCDLYGVLFPILSARFCPMFTKWLLKACAISNSFVIILLFTHILSISILLLFGLCIGMTLIVFHEVGKCRKHGIVDFC